MAHPSYHQRILSDASGVAEVPSHWAVKRLRFAARLNPSRGEIDLPSDALVSFVPMDAVGEGGGLALNTERPLDDIGSGYTYFANGDVVVAKITPCFENGKGALAAGLKNGIALGTTELHVVRPGIELEPRFLFYISIADHFRDIGESEMYGAGGQKRIPDTFIKDFRAALPPRSEQCEIADFLDRETARIDSLVEKKRRLLGLLKEKRLATITQAVTKGLNPNATMKDSGTDWLGQIPSHWQVKRLDRINDPYRPIMYGIVLPGPHVDGGVPIIKGGDVRPDRLNPLTLNCTTQDLDEQHAKSRVIGGDLVYAIRGSFGDVEIVPEALTGANLTQDAARIAPTHEFSREWLLFALKAETSRQQLDARSIGATIKGINIRDLKRVCLPIPPRAEQEALAVFLRNRSRQFKRLIEATNQHIDSLMEYRSALISAAVAGKIDVRGPMKREFAA